MIEIQKYNILRKLNFKSNFYTNSYQRNYLQKFTGKGSYFITY